MKLENIPQNFIYLERWVNNPKYSTTAQYSEVSKKYHPRHGGADFSLPVFNIPKEKVEIFTANPSRSLLERMIRKDSVPFFCHPDYLPECKDDKLFVNPISYEKVSPTSSTRTVMVWDSKKPFMIKLHLNKRISRFIRRLTRSSILHSVNISKECAAITKAIDCPAEFAYLPESIGVNYKDKNVGYLIREFQPRPLVREPRYLIPFFALYSQDEKKLEEETLLTQIISKYGAQDPFQFFMQSIFDPFMKCWTFAFLNFGLLFEAHGQNTLLELDANFYPRRVVYRDFQSTPVDPLIRSRRDLTNSFEKHVIGEGVYPRLIEHSLIYDHFIGDYLFSSLEAFFKKHYKMREDDFRCEVKKVFRKYIAENLEKEFFPQGHITFSNEFHDNICPLLYLHETPKYRAI